MIHLEVSLKEQVLMEAKKILQLLCKEHRLCNNDSNVKFGDGVFAQTFVGG